MVFSEPMVALARTPSRLKPAFFHITPAVAGTYRWSGTTILILTPAKRLPLATKYDVTIDAGTAAISGRKLAAPYTFSFMTPTAQLLQTHWYRPGGRYDAAPIIVLRFNQPVKPEDVAAHVRASFEKHDFIAAADSGRRPGAAAGDRSVGRCRPSPPKCSARAPRRRPPRPCRWRSRRTGTRSVSSRPPTWWSCRRRRPCRPTAGSGSRPTGGFPRWPDWRPPAARRRTRSRSSRRSWSSSFRCEDACDPENNNPIHLPRAGQGGRRSPPR